MCSVVEDRAREANGNKDGRYIVLTNEKHCRVRRVLLLAERSSSSSWRVWVVVVAAAVCMLALSFTWT